MCAARSIHLIVGPNGGGKSSLIEALLGQTAFTGSVRCHFVGSGRLGYVPQSFPVDATLPVTVPSCWRSRGSGCRCASGCGERPAPPSARLLERVGLAGLEGRRLGALSGGELRRVLLAQAMDPPPELLVLDEPGSGLDAASVARLEAIVRALRDEHGTTVLMVSHDLDQVRRLADAVTWIDRTVRRDGPLGPGGDFRPPARGERRLMDRFYAWLAELAGAGRLPDALRYPFVTRGLLAVLVLAPLLGGMSHLVVARRLAFFSTALGQAALTGLTLGLLAGEPINAPYAGMFGFCLGSRRSSWCTSSAARGCRRTRSSASSWRSRWAWGSASWWRPRGSSTSTRSRR